MWNRLEKTGSLGWLGPRAGGPSLQELVAKSSRSYEYRYMEIHFEFLALLPKKTVPELRVPEPVP